MGLNVAYLDTVEYHLDRATKFEEQGKPKASIAHALSMLGFVMRYLGLDPEVAVSAAFETLQADQEGSG